MTPPPSERHDASTKREVRGLQANHGRRPGRRSSGRDAAPGRRSLPAGKTGRRRRPTARSHAWRARASVANAGTASAPGPALPPLAGETQEAGRVTADVDTAAAPGRPSPDESRRCPPHEAGRRAGSAVPSGPSTGPRGAGPPDPAAAASPKAAADTSGRRSLRPGRRRRRRRPTARSRAWKAALPPGRQANASRRPGRPTSTSARSPSRSRPSLPPGTEEGPSAAPQETVVAPGRPAPKGDSRRRVPTTRGRDRRPRPPGGMAQRPPGANGSAHHPARRRRNRRRRRRRTAPSVPGRRALVADRQRPAPRAMQSALPQHETGEAGLAVALGAAARDEAAERPYEEPPLAGEDWSTEDAHWRAEVDDIFAAAEKELESALQHWGLDAPAFSGPPSSADTLHGAALHHAADPAAVSETPLPPSRKNGRFNHETASPAPSARADGVDTCGGAEAMLGKGQPDLAPHGVASRPTASHWTFREGVRPMSSSPRPPGPPRAPGDFDSPPSRIGSRMTAYGGASLTIGTSWYDMCEDR